MLRPPSQNRLPFPFAFLIPSSHLCYRSVLGAGSNASEVDMLSHPDVMSANPGCRKDLSRPLSLPATTENQMDVGPRAQIPSTHTLSTLHLVKVVSG